MPRIRIARTTGRPAKRAPRGIGVVRRLTEAELRDELRLTPEQRNMLDRIAAGRPPRNANAIMRALEAKLAYTLSKPKQQLEHTGPDGGPVQHTLEVTFVDGEAPSDGEPPAR